MRTIQKKAAKAASGCLLLLLLYGCASNADAVQILDRDTSDRSQEAVSQDGEELPRQTDTIVVYVCGEVKHPGVYELEAGSRIYQAIEKAGGLTAKAAKNSLNLADYLSDGQMITVVSETETDVAEAKEDARVNINTAEKDLLMTLPGIGASKAEAIVAYREDQGTFASTEDILNVSGIGNGVYEKIKDLIRIN
ncbi:MAG: ComEA family DNA-binding protein [Lachnospiraceae bacterium]|nr:ComEA family DNA-binding protein [Lachnospiraceae bacterium]